MDDALSALVRRALAMIASEQPHGYRELAQTLSNLRVTLSCKGERCLYAESGRVRIAPATEGGVLVQMDVGTLLDLLDARCSLVQAVRTNRLFVQGPATQIARTYAAMTWFVGSLLQVRDASALKTALEKINDRP